MDQLTLLDEELIRDAEEWRGWKIGVRATFDKTLIWLRQMELSLYLSDNYN
jgi:hypothetical protein